MNGSREYAEIVKNTIYGFDEQKLKKIDDGFQIVICPPVVFSDILMDGHGLYSIGAQNCSSEVSGSYTGEISAGILKDAGIGYVILGHSERRKYLGENENLILKKLDNALESRITPIVCMYSFEDDKRYIDSVINDFLNHKLAEDLIVAYEPEFSIGSGISDSIDSIKNNILNVKNIVKNKNLGNKRIYVIYGGSVNNENFLNILKVCDGVLIGKASLDYNSFYNFFEKL
jgi:triosephosphate isomerase